MCFPLRERVPNQLVRVAWLIDCRESSRVPHAPFGPAMAWNMSRAMALASERLAIPRSNKVVVVLWALCWSDAPHRTLLAAILRAIPLVKFVRTIKSRSQTVRRLNRHCSHPLSGSRVHSVSWYQYSGPSPFVRGVDQSFFGRHGPALAPARWVGLLGHKKGGTDALIHFAQFIFFVQYL